MFIFLTVLLFLLANTLLTSLTTYYVRPFGCDRGTCSVDSTHWGDDICLKTFYNNHAHGVGDCNHYEYCCNSPGACDEPHDGVTFSPTPTIKPTCQTYRYGFDTGSIAKSGGILNFGKSNEFDKNSYIFESSVCSEITGSGMDVSILSWEYTGPVGTWWMHVKTGTSSLRLSNMSMTYFEGHSSTRNILQINGASVKGWIYNVRFETIKLYHYLIFSHAGSTLEIDDSHFYHIRGGSLLVYIVAFGHIKNTVFSSCFDHNYLIYLHANSHFTIEDVTFSENYNIKLDLIYILGTTSVNFKNCIFTYNRLINIGYYLVRWIHPSSVNFENCIFESNTVQYQLIYTSSLKPLSFIDCTFRDNNYNHLSTSFILSAYAITITLDGSTFQNEKNLYYLLYSAGVISINRCHFINNVVQYSLIYFAKQYVVLNFKDVVMDGNTILGTVFDNALLVVLGPVTSVTFTNWEVRDNTVPKLCLFYFYYSTYQINILSSHFGYNYFVTSTTKRPIVSTIPPKLILTETNFIDNTGYEFCF
jgi:hypothetical protein